MPGRVSMEAVDKVLCANIDNLGKAEHFDGE
jgi:hypothetical protein